jgi:predicted ArsR family transcriptional regulator
MKKTKQRVIRLLKRNGGLTTGELSELLNISATAVRRHLKTLESEDLIRYKTVQRGMGRPSYVYELADRTPDLFSQNYTAFANTLLQEFTELDEHKNPYELFDQRQAPRKKKYIKLTKGETLTDRVASLAQLMESEGRMTTWQQVDDDCFILREHNCPLYQLAGRFDHPCQCEIALLKKALKAHVTRVGHIAKGDVACVYEIASRENGSRDEQPLVHPLFDNQRSLPVRPLARESYAYR